MLNSIICAADPLSGLDNETHELSPASVALVLIFRGQL